MSTHTLRLDTQPMANLVIDIKKFKYSIVMTSQVHFQDCSTSIINMCHVMGKNPGDNTCMHIAPTWFLLYTFKNIQNSKYYSPLSGSGRM
jgi:hypothetical protein